MNLVQEAGSVMVTPQETARGKQHPFTRKDGHDDPNCLLFWPRHGMDEHFSVFGRQGAGSHDPRTSPVRGERPHRFHSSLWHSLRSEGAPSACRSPRSSERHSSQRPCECSILCVGRFHSPRRYLLPTRPPQSCFEQYTVITGELVGSVADDFQNGTSTTHYTLHTVDRDFDLSFAAAIPGIDHMLHNQVTVRGIILTNIMAADSLVRATPTVASHTH